MIASETAKVIASLLEVYGDKFLAGRSPNRLVEIWDKYFDEPYAVVSAAVHAFITSDAKGFPPNIGQIKEKIAQMFDSEPDEMQAWAIVYKALERSSREEYAKLPTLIQGCIGSYHTFYEWGQEDISTLNTVTKAGFMRTYRARAQKQREYGKLPDFARGAFPAIAAQEPYRLPAAMPKEPEIDDRVPVPDEVLQKVNVLRGAAQRRELLQAAENGKRVDGLNKMLDGMKGSKP